MNTDQLTAKLQDLEALCIGHGIALQILVQNADDVTRASISLAARQVPSETLAMPLTDRQIDRIGQALRSLLLR